MPKLNVALIDADLLSNGTRHPNLALMKISQYCRDKSECKLLFRESQLDTLDTYDFVIVSKVFTFSKLNKNISNLLKNKNLRVYNYCIVELFNKYSKYKPDKTVVAIGGTGFFSDGGRDLHMDIEHIMPDYHLYDDYIEYMVNSTSREKKYYCDYTDYSIGFTSRGCFRKCEFCVNKKYDKCQFHAHIDEFLDETRPGIYLWDDNVFACKEWKIIFKELNDSKKPFQFRQGLDIRLLSKNKAQILSKSRYAGDIIFAFDHVDDHIIIKNKLKIWRSYSNKSTKMYILCAYDPWEYNEFYCGNLDDRPFLKKMTSISDQDKRDLMDIEGVFFRISILMKYKCIPYIMRYEKYKDSKYKGVYTQLARWCNQPQFYKKMSFREFCEANQRYSSSNKECASMRALNLLEANCNKKIKRFIDMKYEDFHN